MKKKRRKWKPFIVRPWSIAPCPTADEVRVAWANRRRSQKDFIWLLSVLGELTCYTDRSLEHLGGFGHIAGRKGGLKAYLTENVPELVCKYKSISRYASLANRLKQAFDIYPPAALSLLHPDLPLPRRNMAFMTNHCRKVYRNHLAKLPPTWIAFDAVVSRRLVGRFDAPHPWGPPLPPSEWAEAESRWLRIIVRPIVKEALAAEHSFYARDYYRRRGPGGGT